MSLEKENNNILSDEALENVAGGELPGYTWLIKACCESCGAELPAGYTENYAKGAATNSAAQYPVLVSSHRRTWADCNY